jgi:hypothetical protein
MCPGEQIPNSIFIPASTRGVLCRRRLCATLPPPQLARYQRRSKSLLHWGEGAPCRSGGRGWEADGAPRAALRHGDPPAVRCRQGGVPSARPTSSSSTRPSKSAVTSCSLRLNPHMLLSPIGFCSYFLDAFWQSGELLLSMLQLLIRQD